jgi:thiol-disulfide isomerase/thioredoxin
MTEGPGGSSERERERPRSRREVERRERQRRALRYGLGGLVGIVVVVLAVIMLMADGDERAPTGSAAGAVRVDGPPRDQPLQEGDPVPSFEAPELFGGTVAWSDYAGRPTVLAVWASWCPHCQVELPVLDRVMQEFPQVGFVTVVTSIGAQPGPTPEEYMRQEGLDFPVAVDDAQGTLGAALGIRAFPTTYFVRSDGTVAMHVEGRVDEATLRSVIAALD